LPPVLDLQNGSYPGSPGIAKNPLGSDPVRSSRDSLRPCASSGHAVGMMPRMRTAVELVSPSDDEDDGDGEAVGMEGTGT